MKTAQLRHAAPHPLARHCRAHHSTLIAVAFALLCTAFPAASATADHACNDSTRTRLEVTVRNVKSSRGSVMLTVYPANKERWLAKRGKLFKLEVPATAPVTHACIALPTAAGYALAVYHDENGNRHFDRNWIGLPVEGFGVSRNPSSLIGLPSLEDSRFDALDGTTTLDIILHY